MIDRYGEGDAGVEMLERRWFAALGAAKNLEAECEVLLGVLELAEDAWRRARSRLLVLESVRDALGEQLAALDGPRAIIQEAVRQPVMSAA